jgi:RNA polymerase sigma factor (sigma-70 family)
MVKTDWISGDCGQATCERVEAAAAVFREHWVMINEAVKACMRNSCEAEDVFQDLFISLVEKPVPAGVRNLRQYLYRTIRNDVTDAVRRQRNYDARIERYARRRPEVVVREFPHDILARGEETHRIFQLVERHLPRHEAEAVMQRYCYDKDTDAAAEAMGVNRRTFSRYLCMGIKKIRELVCA